jgi:Flp pilus assembly protein TadB
MNRRGIYYRFQGLGAPPGQPPGPFARIVASIVMAAIFIATLMFSALVFAVLLVVGLGAAGWFWWRTRELRRVLREHEAANGLRGAASTERGGVVLEGETVRDDSDESGTPR